MKNLFLMRHAKSKWDENLSDEFRSITENGKFKTEKVAHFLKDNFELKFDKVFSSKAIRAKETSQLVKPILFHFQEIHIEEELYTFSHYLLDKWIRNLDNQLQNVLIFGHNPAFTDVTNQLGNKMIYNLSTSAFVWIQFESDDWKTIETGKTIKIIKPKEIK
ncbi:SixA phosphatase family protein [Empedobacter tilapiae]|uniref:Histidine phosphatase family protein n=1 Tax=Empedobacter tilapiae TaxID=2491114 RepID=A0A4Z1BQJ1_9FLAO|nr:histidine phosphatase family protein [Empedobacter tilapiae]TGN29764.1 histidine phosphatase family protein [Empedobacter tilapiae]